MPKMLRYGALVTGFLTALVTGSITRIIPVRGPRTGAEELKQFHNENIANKPYTYCIVASEKKLTEEQMKKYGEVKKLSLEEIFGY